jgi:hypothetical protein
MAKKCGGSFSDLLDRLGRKGRSGLAAICNPDKFLTKSWSGIRRVAGIKVSPYQLWKLRRNAFDVQARAIAKEATRRAGVDAANTLAKFRKTAQGQSALARKLIAVTEEGKRLHPHSGVKQTAEGLRLSGTGQHSHYFQTTQGKWRSADFVGEGLTKMQVYRQAVDWELSNHHGVKPSKTLDELTKADLTIYDVKGRKVLIDTDAKQTRADWRKLTPNERRAIEKKRHYNVKKEANSGNRRSVPRQGSYSRQKELASYKAHLPELPRAAAAGHFS